MSLKDRIQEDMKVAMRARDADQLLAIRMLMASIKQREIDERIVLDDAAVISVVDKLIKQRKDSVAAYDQAARADLADKERAEITVLSKYLPARLSVDEVDAKVASLVSELAASGPGDMARVMAAAKALLGGRAEMAIVSASVKQRLNTQTPK
jgi:uncharacterized protein